MEGFKLREDLMLGVATASAQIEGGTTNNNWYEWTKNGDVCLDGTNSLRCTNSWKQWKRDIDVQKELGIQCYRFSIEWARIEPEENVFDDEAIEHYITQIEYMKSLGIKPLVTLHHFSNPWWFELKGGWEAKTAKDDFLKFAKYAVDKLLPYCDEYCTINEPNVYASNCYLLKDWYPCKGSFKAYNKVLKNFAKSHIEIYNYIKEKSPESKVGFANHIACFHPKKKHNIFHKYESHLYNKFFNDVIMDAMMFGKFRFPLGFIGRKHGKYGDFCGINYYARHDVSKFKNQADPRFPHNDLGWSIYPEGIKEICEKFYKRYKTEIFITENGTADKEDAYKARYLAEHIKQINELNYVKHYYQWTLLDNFEWKEGEAPKFGIVKYNYDEDTIEIKDSGRFYQELIKNKEVNEDMIKRYIHEYTK